MCVCVCINEYMCHCHKPLSSHNTVARAFLLCLCINRCTCVILCGIWNPGVVSISQSLFTSIGIPIIKLGRFHHRLIFFIKVHEKTVVMYWARALSLRLTLCSPLFLTALCLMQNDLLLGTVCNCFMDVFYVNTFKRPIQNGQHFADIS